MRAKSTIWNRCIDCVHPACSNKKCRTCARCRNELCEQRFCPKIIKPLPVKERPTTLKARNNYKCHDCAGTLVRCRICKTTNRWDFDKKALARKKNEIPTCRQCATPPCTDRACPTCEHCRNEACSHSSAST